MPDTTKTRLSFLPDFPGRDRLYRPLNADKSEIRVITIWPSEDCSEPISCSLQTISIAQGRGSNYYHALSYYWGSTAEGDTEKIAVHPESLENRHDDGFHVPVTKQLTGALRQFRSRMESMDHPLVLWTDAVCINQLDADERAQQVTIMRHVYASAVNTWVWLGEDDPLAEQGLANIFALSLLQLGDPEFARHPKPAKEVFDHTNFDVNVDLPRLEEANTFIKQLRSRDHFIAILDGSEHGILGDDIPIQLTELFHTLVAFCNVPYWYRGWVLQEVCANEDVVLHCGPTRCCVSDWLDFLSFCDETLRLSDGLLSKELDPDLVISGFSGWLDLVLMSLFGFRRSRLSGKGPEAIFCFNDPIWSHLSNDLWSLFHYNRWQTTDPRDRVYALQGFAPGFMQLGLKPNYRIPTEEVFIQTTLEVFYTMQSWSAPQFIYPSASPYLPSWTIDFTLPTADTECFLDRIGNKFNTAPGTRSNVMELEQGVIVASGFLYDEIVAVTPVHSPLDLQKSSANPGRNSLFWKWWNTLMSSGNQRLLSRRENDVWTSYCRTLCLDSELFSRNDGATRRQWKLDSDPVKRDLPRELAFLLEDGIFSSARLVVTRTGRIGLAPLAVEPGDYIAILAGGDVPFALRKVRLENTQRDDYRLLGGCYIDGIMYGNAVFGRAFEEYTTVKRCSFTGGELEMCGLPNEDGVVKCSVGLAFLELLCLV